MCRFITLAALCFVASLTQVAGTVYGDHADESTLLTERTTSEGVAQQPRHAHVNAEQLGVEYRGLIRLGNRTMVSLRSTALDKQQWVSLGREGFGVVVREVSADGRQLSVSRDGDLYLLTLSRATGGGSEAMSMQLAEGVQDVSAGQQLTPYTSLNPKLRERFFHPRFIPTLEASGIEVPNELRRRAVGYQATSASAGDSEVASQLAANSATSMNNSRKVNPNPTLNTALTVNEKIERSIANGYAYQP